ncbi:hypothetical protein L9F63_004947 [Diploptera punctata]|uniref:Ammonium transporter AmtB-like domain-containing protein n=1 Tax=Diploptera punctata TaxID=6984 RepID=A0AAD7ZF90_DIPPU|nr:hypothetical protein L9F63_004947 [Diploptera punctata]
MHNEVAIMNIRQEMVILITLQVVFIIFFVFFTRYDPQLSSLRPATNTTDMQHFYPKVAIIVIMAITAGYDHGAKPAINTEHSNEEENLIDTKHPVFQDVHVMVFIGFGFLMTFLKKYGFSAIGFNFLIASLNVQWSILCNGFFHHGHGENKVNINIQSLLSADLATAALLISYGAVLGKTTPIQLVVMGLIETAVFAANEHLGLQVLKVTDSGGSIFVHAFGAYFGLAVSLALGHGKIISQGQKLEKEGSSYTSDTFAMIGTVFLWLFWPSFNAALVEGDDQHRAVINTYLSLTACCVTAFALSAMVSHENKFDMVHIQNATLAGGVAIGTSCDMMVHPFGALIVGVLAGTLSIAGYHYLQPFLLRSLKLHDTCGVAQPAWNAWSFGWPNWSSHVEFGNRIRIW